MRVSVIWLDGGERTQEPPSHSLLLTRTSAAADTPVTKRCVKQEPLAISLPLYLMGCALCSQP